MRWSFYALAGSVAASAVLLTAAQADDSSAALGAGGVTFTKTDSIRMAAEDLRISPKKVQIHFAFVNDGPKDIETTVAFPLPDVDTSEYWNSPLGTTTQDPVNFVGFTARVNGNPISIRSEQRAILKGKDVTATLQGIGVPVNVVMGNYEKLDKLPLPKKKQLAAAKLIELDEGGNVYPQWTIRTRFYWTQRFPAGKTVIVDHSYQPVTGGTFYTTYDLKPGTPDGGRTWQKDYCMDPPTMSRVRKMLDAQAKKKKDPNDGLGDMLQIWSTDYVLSTAKNWKGGIGKFHLTLDKLRPQNTLSLCWDGDLRKSSATTFEFSATNYVPTRDVKMVVLSDSGE
jgi:hypothetical protein